MSYAYDYEEDVKAAALSSWMSASWPPEPPSSDDFVGAAAYSPAVNSAGFFVIKRLPVGARAGLAIDYSAFTAPEFEVPAATIFSGSVPYGCIVSTDHIPPAMFTVKGSGTFSAVTLTTVCNNAASITGKIATPALPDPLAGYEQYATRNWDGYDADPISPATLRTARTFLRVMPRTFGMPDIAPGSDGTIGLEWQFSNRSLRKLFIDIGPGGVWKGFWRKVTDEHKVLQERSIGQDTAHELARLFKELDA